MRTSLLALVATVVLVLVGGLAAAAQSTDPLAPGTAIVQVVDAELVSPGLMRPDETKTVYHEQGRQMEMTWAASDARLSGDVICAGNREVNRDGSFVESETFVITNDGGRWVGQSMGLAAANPVPDTVVGNGLLPVSPDHEDFILLRGEGGYEGLSAIVDADWNTAPATITGSIFSGELPAAPDLATIG